MATNPTTNNKNSTIRKFDNTISCFSAWKIASVKIDNPADEIRATTAGLKLAKMVWTPEKLRYL